MADETNEERLEREAAMSDDEWETYVEGEVTALEERRDALLKARAELGPTDNAERARINASLVTIRWSFDALMGRSLNRTVVRKMANATER